MPRRRASDACGLTATGDRSGGYKRKQITFFRDAKYARPHECRLEAHARAVSRLR